MGIFDWFRAKKPKTISSQKPVNDPTNAFLDGLAKGTVNIPEHPKPKPPITPPAPTDTDPLRVLKAHEYSRGDRVIVVLPMTLPVSARVAVGTYATVEMPRSSQDRKSCLPSDKSPWGDPNASAPNAPKDCVRVKADCGLCDLSPQQIVKLTPQTEPIFSPLRNGGKMPLRKSDNGNWYLPDIDEALYVTVSLKSGVTLNSFVMQRGAETGVSEMELGDYKWSNGFGGVVGRKYNSSDIVSVLWHTNVSKYPAK